MRLGPVPSQSRIKALVKVASASSGVSEADICFSRARRAVRVRHTIWRDLLGQGFGYKPVARAWGVDHTAVYYAMNVCGSRVPLLDREAA